MLFQSYQCPTVICSPNTCYWRVTTSVDSWEPRSISHHHILVLHVIRSSINYFLVPLLSYYCYFHITPVTSAFPGAAELTTQLLSLISILYLPLCRINKFRFYFPRRLLRSPILVGYQDCFLAPLPGRHSSTHKFTWGVHSTSLSAFILFYFVLLSFLLSSLFVLSLL